MSTRRGGYRFTANDNGVHPFNGLVLRTKGAQTVSGLDTIFSSLSGKKIVNVL